MAQRFAASAIAIAIVVARFLAGSGAPLPHAHGARTALATAVSPARSPARSLRADRGPAELARISIAGALLLSAPPIIPGAPPPCAAPPFVDPLPPLPPPLATAARARAPPAQV